jgi:hypothetical protein
MRQTRRQFFNDVGKGMLTASLGSSLAFDLGLGTVQADDTSDRLTFGKLEPLVALLQETKSDVLQPLIVEKLNNGTDLRTLVSAASLANARTFGGEDYVGFHTLMALYPSFQMAQELPKERQPLPVMKVIYRNATRIQEKGGPKSEVLKPVKPSDSVKDATELRELVRRHDLQNAEAQYAALAKSSADDALNNLLPMVHDGLEVHRIVLVSRAWDLVNLIGKEQAHTLLRQSVRFCIQEERPNFVKYSEPIRKLIPKLLDQHKLANLQIGKKRAEDNWIEKMSKTIFESTPEQAADAIAAAFVEGFDIESIAGAISLATNQLILRDAGRPKNQTSANKPVGSVHGDSIGVHACDSANAWRNLALVSNARNAIVGLILSGYQAAHDRVNRGGDFLNWEALPTADARAKLKITEASDLLKEAEAAIKAQNQAQACLVVHRYGELGYKERPMLDLLLKYAISEDGALHAEKYYRTVCEEFAATRPAFRWRQIVGLARVTASEFGQPAPGYADACKLLKV